jgi:prepilin-type N-terminal cleavage/methylation domain-containing protein
MTKRLQRGFTLIETLVAVVLVTIGFVAVFGGISSLNRAEAHARETELLQRLAMEKINEIGPVIDPQSADTSGDFSDRGYSDITWKMDLEPSGADNVDTLTLTTTRGEDSQPLITLLYIPPTTTTGSTTP